jgi:hypothetical protein
VPVKTEFEFALPDGYTDEDGVVHREGTMRLTRAKDELTPLGDYRVQNDRRFAIILTLTRVITRLGARRGIYPDMLAGLSDKDLKYLQDFYFKLNDQPVAAEVHCAQCKQGVAVDLSTGEQLKYVPGRRK